jgi:hypothetical protein
MTRARSGSTRPPGHGRLVHDAGLVKLFAPLRSPGGLVPGTRRHPIHLETPVPRPGLVTTPTATPPPTPSQKRGLSPRYAMTPFFSLSCRCWGPQGMAVGHPVVSALLQSRTHQGCWARPQDGYVLASEASSMGSSLLATSSPPPQIPSAAQHSPFREYFWSRFFRVGFRVVHY